MMDQHDNLSAAENPSQTLKKPANPCILVIFGIAGDLTKRLLFPALCNLGSAGLLDENFCIVGVAKESYNDRTFREQIIKNIAEFITDPDAKKFGLQFVNQIYYISGSFADANVYTQLKNKIAELAPKACQNCLFYFASPPAFIESSAAFNCR